MRKVSAIAAGLGVAVILGVPVVGAEMTDQTVEVSKTSTSAMKPRKVYNPATNFARFAKDLALTQVQQKEIEPLLTDLEKQLLPLRKLTYQRQGQRGAPLVEEHYQKIRECLKEEQLKKFDEMVAGGEITPFAR